MPTRAGIALGSNLGNRLTNLRQARDLLFKLVGKKARKRQAPIYQTAPVNCPEDSPEFYNTVIEFDYDGTPHSLLKAARAVEKQLGRIRPDEPNAPRAIDVDLLYLGDQQVLDNELELPHPRLTSRRFVLKPLADIRSDLVLPGDQVTIADHLRHLDTDEPEPVLVQLSW